MFFRENIPKGNPVYWLFIIQKKVRHVLYLDPLYLQAVDGAHGYLLWGSIPALDGKCSKWLIWNQVYNFESQKKETLFTGWDDIIHCVMPKSILASPEW